MNTRIFFGTAAALFLVACGNGSSSTPASAPQNASGTAQNAPAPQTGGSSLLDKINSKGTIIVGTMGTYAPFTYHEKDGKLTGYDVEVTRAVAEKLGVKVEFKESPWDAMMSGLKAGRFDVVANQVALTSPEARLRNIKGIKTAVMLASNYDEVAQKMGADIVHTDTMAQGLMLVQQKRAELTLNDELSLLDYLKKTPDSGLKSVWRTPDTEKLGAGLVINKGNEAALEKINGAMKELQEDGTLKRLGEQFFGEDVSVH